MQTLVLQNLPSMLSLYSKAAVKKGHSGALPKLTIAVPGIRAEKAVAKKYDRICHFPESRFLAPTYLHVLSFPLHMRLMTDPTMPLKPMGLVHVRNKIKQFRQVEQGELLYIECSVGESREVDAGLEFDILTRIEASGELVYEGLSTNLSRRPSKSSGDKKKRQPPEPFDIIQTWSLPAGLGRSYGAVSGDRNPIHLWPTTAKLFGFKRHIAHGMWSKARVLAALSDQIGNQSFEIDVTFKTPVFLPAKVEFSYTQEEAQTSFLMRSTSGKPHLEGKLTLL
ncbi:MaoC/PaaZ C-terminal domain-containing protein [Parendozoicomonas sp. Alg238-R29]|uniref:MaoC family dehydratase n=1 Tax=Parendozoicomonas sp. Alg238-R29 TaxID=2993446 RepID=UPI00248ED97C|nr:MaoC/PaaZ C-terminal domain-containing protein [Parendozoicomonas sp. Alg238-R29]